MLGKLKAIFTRGASDRMHAEEEHISDVEVQAATPGNLALAPGGRADARPSSGTEDAMLAGELRAAQKIQMGLVPKTFPPIVGCPPFDLYALLEPAREIGGDFYDFWLNGSDNLVLVVGDVSGKGIPAALFMAVCRTYLRAFSRSIPEPATLLGYLNNEVSRHNESCMFVTLFCAVVHIPTGRVTYANAGHNPPFVRKKGGDVHILEMTEDMPIGFMYGAEYGTRTLTLETGDSLLLYTDGMPEAFNPRQQMLGGEKSLDLFRAASAGGSCRSAVGQLRAEIAEFAEDAEQSDDITLMMYGQLDQTTHPGLSIAREDASALKGDTGILSLSAFGNGIHRATRLEIDKNLGRSLSGLKEGLGLK